VASKPYSVRFMSGRGSTRQEIFTVPEGKRAVVLHIATVVFAAAASSYCTVIVHGAALYYQPFAPGAYAGYFEAVRFVAYERETISCTVAGPDVAYSVDGYLLEDSVGRPDDADNEVIVYPRIELPLPQPT